MKENLNTLISVTANLLDIANPDPMAFTPLSPTIHY